jgi:DNA-binding MarR family transcriptional regulator/GNAT superfamily N-acetyltransferase
MTQPVSAAEVQALRRFSRSYSRRIGVLEDELPGRDLTLTEARLIVEIADRERPTAAHLARDLGLDPAHVSRTVAALTRRHLVARARSAEDARQSLLALTAAGRDVFARLDARANEAMGALLARLDSAARRRLVASLAKVETLLAAAPPDKDLTLLRPHRAGDMGWIIRRHAELYQEEFGWDASFEAFVAEIGAAFLKSFDPARDCCWIAERGGEIVGSICLGKVSPEIAKLRLLLVEPGARGLGIGSRLVAESIAFARRAGYARITLWSNPILQAARRLYEQAGFRLVGSEPYRRFGKDLVGQAWELTL